MSLLHVDHSHSFSIGCILSETALDLLRLLPFLFLACLLSEWISRSARRARAVISGSGRLGPLFGSLLGLIPQCGLSAAAARLYGNPTWASAAQRVLDTVRRQSYFDGFFHDHALRDADGALRVVKEDISETCQYYAFFTGAADLTRDRDFFDLLCRDFGVARAETGLYPEVGLANAFIGNYLRIELMMQAGLHEQVLEQIRGFFAHMAEQTGTLWEHQSSSNSCNHGFASHVIVWLYRIFGKNL